MSVRIEFEVPFLVHIVSVAFDQEASKHRLVLIDNAVLLQHVFGDFLAAQSDKHFSLILLLEFDNSSITWFFLLLTVQKLLDSKLR